MKRMLSTLLAALLPALLLGPAAAQEGSGIYADFETSLGGFTARLDYERAPKAVAAFVGLATGEKAWLDAFGNVHASTPFYDGTLFHCVLPGVAVQGGGIEDPYDVWTPSNGVVDVFAPIPIGPLETNVPPGGATNLIYDGVFTFTNAPGEPITVVRGGEPEELMQTNRAIHRLTLVSTASYGGGQPSVRTTNYFFTNFNATTALTTTNIPFTLFIPLANPTDAPIPFMYSGEIQRGTSNTLYAHSVATNFANAGFYYPDAFSNGLVHAAGALAMAHNTFANTDGSQFFVCATNVPGWDGGYTVFGQVVSGMDIVRQLASVPVDAANNNRPTNDFVLRSVAIRRVGAAAEAFDIHAQRLPVVDNLAVMSRTESNRLDVSFEIPAKSEAAFRWTTDLRRTGWGAWNSTDFGYQSNASPRAFYLPSPPDRLFLHASAVTYPDAWTLPESVAGRTFTFLWDTEPPTIETLAFGNSILPPGTYARVSGTNTCTGELYLTPVNWTRLPYAARFYFADDYYPYFHTYMLRWDPGAPAGTATGLLLQPGTNVVRSVTGTFTLGDTP